MSFALWIGSQGSSRHEGREIIDETVEAVAIVDHHKIGDITTKKEALDWVQRLLDNHA